MAERHHAGGLQCVEQFDVPDGSLRAVQHLPVYVREVAYELCGDLRGDVTAQVDAAQPQAAGVPVDRDGEREHRLQTGHVLGFRLAPGGGGRVVEEETREDGARGRDGLRLAE